MCRSASCGKLLVLTVAISPPCRPSAITDVRAVRPASHPEGHPAFSKLPAPLRTCRLISWTNVPSVFVEIPDSAHDFRPVSQGSAKAGNGQSCLWLLRLQPRWSSESSITEPRTRTTGIQPEIVHDRARPPCATRPITLLPCAGIFQCFLLAGPAWPAQLR